MFCPECGAEYLDWITECETCGIQLVEVKPKKIIEEAKDLEIVTVFESGDPAIIPIVKSLLDDAGIQYFVKGENLQSWLGLGGWGLGRDNVIFGCAEFQVCEDDEAEAREILKDFIKPEGYDAV